MSNSSFQNNFRTWRDAKRKVTVTNTIISHVLDFLPILLWVYSQFMDIIKSKAKPFIAYCGYSEDDGYQSCSSMLWDNSCSAVEGTFVTDMNAISPIVSDQIGSDVTMLIIVLLLTAMVFGYSLWVIIKEKNIRLKLFMDDIIVKNDKRTIVFRVVYIALNALTALIYSFYKGMVMGAISYTSYTCSGVGSSTLAVRLSQKSDNMTFLIFTLVSFKATISSLWGLINKWDKAFPLSKMIEETNWESVVPIQRITQSELDRALAVAKKSKKNLTEAVAEESASTERVTVVANKLQTYV
ncbi:hypothetical protein PCE1_001236 [Barthelona sp. PCE]